MRILLLIAVLACCGCVAHVSENNIVQPKPGAAVVSGVSPDGAWTIEALALQVDPAVSLRGAAFRKPGATATVLYFGGNGFVLSQHYEYLLRIYQDLPVDVIAFDHRGYGGSTGTASLEQLMSDGLPIYDHVKALPTRTPGPLIVHGHSLGSFVAGNIANQRTLDGLVLESSATSAEQWVQGFADHSIWVRKVDVDASIAGKGNAGVMAELDEPVLIVVGQNDTTTRPDMSEALFAQAAVADDRKELLVVEGAGHMDASISAAFAEALSRLLGRVQLAAR